MVVADFPTGPVKITAGSPALPPTSRLHPHGPLSGEARSRVSYSRQTEVLQHTVCVFFRAESLEFEHLSFVTDGTAHMQFFIKDGAGKLLLGLCATR